MSTDPPAWDEERAKSMIGARILVGMTYTSARGNRLEQMFGTIISVNSSRGFEIKLEGTKEGKVFWIPPSIDAFFPAAPGEYRLKGTGEVVIDPDFTTTWTVEGSAEGTA